MAQTMHDQHPGSEIADSSWRTLYRIGAAAALAVVVTGLLEIIITFLPGGSTSPQDVTGWFVLFQGNGFLALRDLGLLNIIINVLGIPTYFALLVAHRRANPGGAALATVVSFIGIATFLATNRAFAMLGLSNQYAAATTEAQRSVLAAAGQAMLSVGQSHTPGTFIGFLLSEVAGIAMSFVMLRGRVFGRVTAYAGILGFALLLVFEICSTFLTGLSVLAMMTAMVGGLLSMAWYILIARRLMQLGGSQGTAGAA